MSRHFDRTGDLDSMFLSEFGGGRKEVRCEVGGSSDLLLSMKKLMEEALCLCFLVLRVDDHY